MTPDRRNEAHKWVVEKDEKREADNRRILRVAVCSLWIAIGSLIVSAAAVIVTAAIAIFSGD